MTAHDDLPGRIGMAHRPPRVLLTGAPGCGKTTIILKTLELLECPMAGFYTEEVRDRDGGSRLGFDVIDLAGRRGPLARVGHKGPRVARYGVDISSFEKIGVRALVEGLGNPETLLVVDELGKMEFLSSRFVDLLTRVFQAHNPVLGTILSQPHPIADKYRSAYGVELIQVRPENREELPTEVARSLAV